MYSCDANGTLEDTEWRAYPIGMCTKNLAPQKVLVFLLRSLDLWRWPTGFLVALPC